jgi:PAS domain S-box-containing protein
VRSAIRALRGKPATGAHYGLAVVLPLFAFAVRYAIAPSVSSVPYLGFFLATLGSAAVGGLGPGLLAAGLGFLLAGPFHPPGGWLHLVDPVDPFAPLRYLISSCSVVAICEVLIRSRERARRAESQVRESEERFRLIGNSAPVLIWMSSPDKLCYWFNEPWLNFRGRTLEQEIGNGWTEGVHPEDLGRCLETYGSSFDAREPFSMEYRLQNNEAQWRWVLDRGIPRYGPSREFLGYIGSCLDIEDRKRTEQALQWANADLEQFAFSASHDLREPIRNIAIHSELIAHRFGKLTDAEGRRYLDYVTAGARHLDTLVSDLLKYTTIGKVDEPVTVVDAEASLRASLTILSEAVTADQAVVTHDPLPLLRIREVHLGQVFQNVIGNALKYRSHETPRIHISAVRTDRHWRIAIADNGIGIEPNYQTGIFGLFKRLHRTEKYAGTGLGLAICQRIVHIYGGRIWVESALGQGATFYFSLPGVDDSVPGQKDGPVAGNSRGANSR